MGGNLAPVGFQPKTVRERFWKLGTPTGRRGVRSRLGLPSRGAETGISLDPAPYTKVGGGEAGGSQLELTWAVSAHSTQPRRPAPRASTPAPSPVTLESWAQREKDRSQQGFQFRAFLTWLPICPENQSPVTPLPNPGSSRRPASGIRILAAWRRSPRESCAPLAEPQCLPGSSPQSPGTPSLQPPYSQPLF